MRQKTKMLICEELVADGADVTIARRMSFVLDDRQVDAIAAGVISKADVNPDCEDCILDLATKKLPGWKQKAVAITGVTPADYDSLFVTVVTRKEDKDKDGNQVVEEGVEDVLISLFEHPEAEAWFNIKYV